MNDFSQAKPRSIPPFRYDIVGSFLRPIELKHARRLFEEGQLSEAQLTEVEDEHISALIKKQKEMGLLAVTDGEFRRSWWHLDFFWGIGGTQKVEMKQTVSVAGMQTKPQSFEIVDKLSYKTHPMVAHFKQLCQLAGNYPVKFAIPSPSLFHFVSLQHNNKVYDNAEQFKADIVAVYQAAIQDFYDAGCRYLQLDDTAWGNLCSSRHRIHLKAQGYDPDQLVKDYVQMLNESIANRPDDMVITLHVCRGNLHSTWFASGGYEAVAEQLFGQVNVDGFFLEYDNERSGGFEPLKYIKHQQVVLGLVTTKHGGLESKEMLKARIAEAAKYVDINQLCISPQCGFASSEEGNILTEEEQWDKIKLVVETAKEVWGG